MATDTPILDRHQGDDWTFYFTYSDSSGRAIDLSPYILMVRLYFSDRVNAQQTFTLASQPTEGANSTLNLKVIDASSGKFACTVPRSATAAIDPTKSMIVKLRIMLKDEDGFIQTIGVLQVRANPV